MLNDKIALAGLGLYSNRYLHLSREDKLAQAVSDLKAEQSGLWHVFTDGSERETTDPSYRIRR